MPDNLVVIKQDEYERMMKAVRFVEGMQRGPVRGQDRPENPEVPSAGTVYVKVTGPIDEDFRPGDTETKYYPCCLTQKIIPTVDEETESGPFSPSDYWLDLDGSEDEEGRVFAWNGGTLIEGNRYSVDPIDVKGKEGEDGQYTIFVVNGSGGCEFPEGGLEAYADNVAITADGCGFTFGLEKWAYNCDGTSDLVSTDTFAYSPPTTTLDVVTDVTATGSCDGTDITITLDVTTTSVKVLNC